MNLGFTDKQFDALLQLYRANEQRIAREGWDEQRFPQELETAAQGFGVDFAYDPSRHE
jgi:hypothetical protein